MFKNSRKYYLENVLSCYEDFVDHRKNGRWGRDQLIRKGINSSIAFYHMREHIPVHIQPSVNSLIALCPDYGLIRDITNVSKHGRITKYVPKITNATQIYESFRMIIFNDEEGEYISSKIEAYVKLDDGSERVLASILYNVHSMWNDKLDNLGIISRIPLIPMIIDPLISREEAEQRQVDMEMLQGEDIEWEFRVEKYNYVTNSVDPVDLTGWQVGLSIYKPPDKASIAIIISHPNILEKIEVEFDVPLSEEQGLVYMKMESKDEQARFINQILENSPSIKASLNKKIIAEIKAQNLKALQ